MRILVVATYCGDDVSPRQFLGGYTGFLRGRGHSVTLAAQSLPGTRSSEESGIHLLGGSSPAASWRRAARTFFGLWPLLRGADFVHVRLGSAWYPSTWAVWLACALFGKPRGASVDGFRHTDLETRWAWPALAGRFLSRCRWVTAVSRAIKNHLSEDHPELAKRVGVVPLARDTEEPGAPEPVADGPFVLCVGRLAPYKGVDLLLFAWRDVCREVPSVKLALCGPETDDGHCRRLAESLGIASRVQFLGERARPEVWSLLRSCLFVVLPSRYESFGVAGVEAAACGKAVIATRVGGPEEYLAHDVTGLLVPPKDPDSLREAILALLRDAPRREAMGARAKNSASRFTWESVGPRYLDLITPLGAD